MYFQRQQTSRELLLLGQLVGLGVGSLLLADAVQPLEGPGLADRLEGLELGHVLGDLHGAGTLDHGLEGHHDVAGQLLGLGELLGGRVTLPGLLGADGEQNHLGLVLLQPLGIQLQGLDALVPGQMSQDDANHPNEINPNQPATVIDGDTDGPGESLAHAGGLDLLQGEATSSALLQVVFWRKSQINIELDKFVLTVSGAGNDGPELAERAGSDLSSLGDTVLATTDLPEGEDDHGKKI